MDEIVNVSPGERVVIANKFVARAKALAPFILLWLLAAGLGYVLLGVAGLVLVILAVLTMPFFLGLMFLYGYYFGGDDQ